MKTVIVDFNNQMKAYANDDDRQGLADVVAFMLSMTSAAKEVASSGKVNMGPYPVMWSAAMNIIPALREMDNSVRELIKDPEEYFDEFKALVKSKVKYPKISDSDIIQAFHVAVELNKLITKEE